MLNEILKICSKNKIEFTYQNEGNKNEVILDENKRTIIINIIDNEDAGLNELLSNTIDKLNQLFQ